MTNHCRSLNGTTLYADGRGFIDIERDGCRWNADRSFLASVALPDGERAALFATLCASEYFETGLGIGFAICFLPL